MNKNKEKIQLLVNGKKVGLNPYVRSVFTEVTRGLLATLKGIDTPPCDVELKITLE